MQRLSRVDRHAHASRTTYDKAYDIHNNGRDLGFRRPRRHRRCIAGWGFLPFSGSLLFSGSLPFRKREHGLQRLGSAEGFAYAPTLVTGVDESFAIVSNEQFGPVLPIVRYCVHAADARVLRLISRDIGGRLHTDGAAATVTWMTS